MIPLLGVDGDVADDDLLALPSGVGSVNLFYQRIDSSASHDLEIVSEIPQYHRTNLYLK